MVVRGGGVCVFRWVVFVGMWGGIVRRLMLWRRMRVLLRG